MTQDQKTQGQVDPKVLKQHADNARLGKALHERFGDEALDIMREVGKKGALEPFAYVARQAGLPVGNGGIADWIKFESFLAKTVNCEYEIAENTPTRGVFKVTKCPMADIYTKIFPDMCRKVIIGGEEAIAETINPKLTATVECYIPEGASSCDIVCTWKDASSRRSRIRK